jgi:hypothetical protein
MPDRARITAPRTGLPPASVTTPWREAPGAPNETVAQATATNNNSILAARIVVLLEEGFRCVRGRKELCGLRLKAPIANCR